MKPIRLISFVALAHLATLNTHAQDGSQESVFEEHPLERMVVTASRIPELANRRAASTIVIDADQIDQMGAIDAGEILKFHAGIDIGRNGGPGQTTSLFVRGSESNHTLVLVDGVRMNPGTIGVSAIQNINPKMIDRIEIVKGPRSTIYGSDAIGAVINIMTRSQDRPRGLDVSVGAGSFDQRRVGIEAGIGDQEFGANLGTAFQQSDGFPTQVGALDDHGHDNISVNGALWQSLDKHRFELDFLRAEGNTEYSDFTLLPLDQDYLNQTVNGRMITTINGNWESAISVSHMIDEIKQNQLNFLGSFDFLETTRREFDWKNTVADGDDNRLILGLNAYNERANALSFGAPIDQNTEVFSAYSEYAIHGANYDVSVAARYTDHDDFGSHSAWHVDSTYNLTPQLQLLAAVGTGFRAPDATDRFGFGGNPELQVEESLTYELGARYRFNSQHLVSLRGFSQDIDNLIIYVVTDPETFAGINQNVDQTETTGLELTYHYSGERLDFLAEAIVQNPEDKSTGLGLLRRAEQSISANATYRLGSNLIGLNVLATGERPDISSTTFSRVTNPGYVLANLTYSRALNENWQVRAKIGNVLDTEYQSADGFNTAERNYYLELNYRLGN